MKGTNNETKQRRLCQEISLRASKTAEVLTCERHYMTMNPDVIYFSTKALASFEVRMNCSPVVSESTAFFHTTDLDEKKEMEGEGKLRS